MCLYAKARALPQEAEKDIVCYKFLIVDGANYSTPCQYMHLGSDVVDSKKNLKAEGMEYVKKTVTYSSDGAKKWFTEVGEGFIHTFIRLKDAKEYVESWRNVYTVRNVIPCAIFKCIIPAGTEYYRGKIYTKDADDKCYASKRIRFVKQVQFFPPQLL